MLISYLVPSQGGWCRAGNRLVLRILFDSGALCLVLDMCYLDRSTQEILEYLRRYLRSASTKYLGHSGCSTWRREVFGEDIPENSGINFS